MRLCGSVRAEPYSSSVFGDDLLSGHVRAPTVVVFAMLTRFEIDPTWVTAGATSRPRGVGVHVHIAAKRAIRISAESGTRTRFMHYHGVFIMVTRISREPCGCGLPMRVPRPKRYLWRFHL